MITEGADIYKYIQYILENVRLLLFNGIGTHDFHMSWLVQIPAGATIFNCIGESYKSFCVVIISVDK